jgi:hypothetical protein
MKRTEYVTDFRDSAKKIKFVDSDQKFEKWLEAVAQSVPFPTTPKFANPISMCFFGKELPESRPGINTLPVRFPCNPRYLHLIEVDEITSIVEPVISLMIQSSLLYRFHVNDFLDAERCVFIDSSNGDGSINLCIAHIENINESCYKNFLYTRLFPSHIIIDIALKIILPSDPERIYSDIKELISEFNRSGLSITFCYISLGE